MARERHPDSFPRSCVTCIAALYACLGSVCAIRYLYMDLAVPGAYVPAPTQIACLLAAASGILYFVRPGLGHRGLLLTTLLALYLAAAEHQAEATAFHLFVLALLCIALIQKSSRDGMAQAETAS